MQSKNAGVGKKEQGTASEPTGLRKDRVEQCKSTLCMQLHLLHLQGATVKTQ